MSVHNRNEVTLFAAPGSCSPVNSEVEAIVDNLGQNGATDSTNSPIMVQVVNTLMQHRKNVLHLNYNESRNEANFARRAIASLIKRLKNDRNSLIGFYSAVVSEGGDVSCCACLPRSLDGRLQIAGHKGFPHLTYINLFRYPKAVKHDVVSLAVCRFPFHLKLDKVCINPYHYTLVSSESQPYMQSFSSAIESEPLKVVFPNLACGSSMSEHTTAVPQIPFSSLRDTDINLPTFGKRNDAKANVSASIFTLPAPHQQTPPMPTNRQYSRKITLPPRPSRFSSFPYANGINRFPNNLLRMGKVLNPNMMNSANKSLVPYHLVVLLQALLE